MLPAFRNILVSTFGEFAASIDLRGQLNNSDFWYDAHLTAVWRGVDCEKEYCLTSFC